MSYQQVKNYRVKLKERMVYVMGGKCKCCGYDKCIQALEFHHINPDQKEFTFSENSNRSWANIRQELPKCILVCANCHREIHQGLINTVLESSFDENKAKEIDEQIEKFHQRTIYYCKYCGTEVSKGYDCCQACAMIERRKAERPSREELKELIRTMPFTQVGKEYGVSDNAIRKWCKAENLPTTKNIINQYSDEEWQKI